MTKLWINPTIACYALQQREFYPTHWEAHCGAGAAKKWKASIKVVGAGREAVTPVCVYVLVGHVKVPHFMAHKACTQHALNPAIMDL
jgi:hypothetical protein